MKKLLPIILIFMIACGAQKQAVNSTVVSTSTPAPVIATSTPVPTDTIKTNSQNVKPIINFFKLANKTPAEIEKIYGKPVEIDTKSIQFKPGEFRIYNKSGERFLQVDYFDGKAVAFYLEIPKASQTQSAEETIKLCGLNLKLSEAEQERSGWSSWRWNKVPAPFYTASISKFDDSGLFWNCEAHIKVAN